MTRSGLALEADTDEIKEKHKEVEGICAPIISKYYGGAAGGGDDGEESDYETTDPVKIGNHCIKKIIILKKVSNTLYKIKMLEASCDYKTNQDKQFDVMQLIADVHFLFDELKNLAKTIKEKCVSQEAALQTSSIIIWNIGNMQYAIDKDLLLKATI